MIKINVDDTQVLNAIHRMVDVSKDITPWWVAMVGPQNDDAELTIRGAINRAFRGQMDPVDFSSWKDLATSTLQEKKRKWGSAPTLIRTGDLFNSLVGATKDTVAPTVIGRKAVFGTRVPYGVFHMTGTTKMPKRRFMGVSKAQAQFFKKTLVQYIKAAASGIQYKADGNG